MFLGPYPPCRTTRANLPQLLGVLIKLQYNPTAIMVSYRTFKLCLLQRREVAARKAKGIAPRMAPLTLNVQPHQCPATHRTPCV